LATVLPRRVVGVLSTLLITLATVTGLAGAAHAEDGYRYWNYFHLQNGKWAFSEVGAGDYKPEDGAVEGFRYGTSTQSQGIEPRADLSKVDFDAVCGDTDAAAGQKRVAVVLDFGDEKADGTPPAPRAECAVVDQGASTQKVLGEVGELRLGSGMLCAIDGYPATGCGRPVKNVEVPEHEQTVSFALPSNGSGQAGRSDAAASQSSSPAGLWTVVGVAVLAALIALAAVLLNRRNKTA
jgi:hypothetical protein